MRRLEDVAAVVVDVIEPEFVEVVKEEDEEVFDEDEEEADNIAEEDPETGNEDCRLGVVPFPNTFVNEFARVGVEDTTAAGEGVGGAYIGP